MTNRHTIIKPTRPGAGAFIYAVALAFFSAMAGSTLASLVDVSSPTTSWTGIRYGGNNGFDPVIDQQTGSAEGDIVGNAQNASVYTFFADRNTPSKTDGDLAFRIRVGADVSPNGFKTAAFVGIITDRASGKIDLFIGVNNSGQTNSIGIYSPGTGLNISPSTTSIGSTALVSYTEAAANYNWMGVNLTSDPNCTNTDIDNGGANEPDYFLTFSVPFSDIVAQLAARGITGITQDSSFSYVIATSTQGNSLNQDLNGVTGSVNSSSTWASLGALSDPMSPVAAVPEVNPAMVVSLLLAAMLGYAHFRQHRARDMASKPLRTSVANVPRRARRAITLIVMVAIVAAGATTSQARTRRRHHANGFDVALQPFSMLHSAVHAVAAPIVHDATRLAFDAAAAPVRLAYHEARTPPVHPPPPSRDLGDYGTAPVNAPIYTPRPARVAESAAYGDALQVAYVVPHGPASAPARRADPAEDEEDLDVSADSAEQPRVEELSGWESSASKPMVEGSLATLRHGIAYAPSRAPQAVKNAIWAANTLRNKPYIWGGGHGSFYDRGYDCSGTVSFALHGAGVIGSPVPSSDLMRFGERGRGRWFTIYSRNGHTFAVIAGLRLDTTDFQNGGNTGPRWHTDMRDTGGYVARHPAGM